MTDLKITSKAKDSDEVMKARQKLEKKMAKENKKINPQAIEETVKSMQQWLNRHQSERIQLKDKSIAPFDANMHPAKIKSKFVNQLLNQLKEEGTQSKPLEGRITQ